MMKMSALRDLCRGRRDFLLFGAVFSGISRRISLKQR